MGKLDISDNAVLQASGATLLALGALNAVGREQFHDFAFTHKVQKSTPYQVNGGLVMLGCGAESIAISRSTSPDATRNALKVHGLTWAVATGMNIYETAQKQQKKETGIFHSVGSGILSGLCLWRGFRD